MSNTYVCTRLILTCHITKYSPKQGNIQVCPNSQNHACGKKCFKNNNHSSFHWHEICSVFVCGHYLFLKSSVFLVLHSRKTVCFTEQIMSTDKYPSISFMPNRVYCLYIFRQNLQISNRRKKSCQKWINESFLNKYSMSYLLLSWGTCTTCIYICVSSCEKQKLELSSPNL